MAIGRTPPESFSEAMSEEESNNLRAQSSKSPFTMSSTGATRPARQSASPTKALMSSPVQPDPEQNHSQPYNKPRQNHTINMYARSRRKTTRRRMQLP